MRTLVGHGLGGCVRVRGGEDVEPHFVLGLVVGRGFGVSVLL